MKRVLTSLALIPPVIYLVLFAPYWATLCAVALVACICYHEFAAIAGKLVPGGMPAAGYAAGLLVLAWLDGTWLVLAIFALVMLALAMRAPDLAHSLPLAAFPLFGVVYIFGAWKCALLARTANPHWLMYGLLVNWAGDVGAYYVGRAFGRHKLARRVSPGKTWEGAGGSIVSASILAGGYLLYFIPSVPPVQAIALTIAANIAGQIGDLAESALKRGAGVKDSGAILPGHGGLLDRVDSTLFALPVVYAYLKVAL
jgi:phosphatidate cytidylyltransferase